MLAFRVAQALSDALVVVVTARTLGANGRGIYALASFAQSAVVSTLGGTWTAMSAEYAHKRATVGRLYAASVAVSALGGFAVSLILGVVALVTWPRAQVLLYPAAIAPFIVLNQIQMGLYNAQGDVRRMSWVSLMTSVAPLVALTAVGVAAPGHAYIALTGWAFAQVMVVSATLAVQRREWRFDWHDLRPLLRRIVKRGMPVSLANGVQLLNYRVDLLVVTALLPLAAVGRYSVAIAMGESLLILSRSLTAGAFDRVIHSDDNQAIALLVTVIRHALWLLIFGSAALVLGGKLLFGPVLGHSFASAWAPMALLVPGIVALGTAESLRAYFLVRLERSREYLITALLSMVANLIFAVALVPVLGLAGAALSTSISYSLGGAYLFIMFVRSGGPRNVGAYLPTRQDAVDYWHLAMSLARRVRRGSPPTALALGAPDGENRTQPAAEPPDGKSSRPRS